MYRDITFPKMFLAITGGGFSVVTMASSVTLLLNGSWYGLMGVAASLVLALWTYLALTQLQDYEDEAERLASSADKVVRLSQAYAEYLDAKERDSQVRWKDYETR